MKSRNRGREKFGSTACKSRTGEEAVRTGVTLNVNFPNAPTTALKFAFSRFGSYEAYNLKFNNTVPYGLGAGAGSGTATAEQAGGAPGGADGGSGGLGDLGGVGDERGEEPGGAEAAVRGKDRGDALGRGIGVEQHPAAAVHLQVDEAGADDAGDGPGVRRRVRDDLWGVRQAQRHAADEAVAVEHRLGSEDRVRHRAEAVPGPVSRRWPGSRTRRPAPRAAAGRAA